MNKKLALSLGILTSSLIALPSTAATFTLIYGSNPSDPVVDTDGVRPIVDTDTADFTTINYGLLVNEAVNGVIVVINREDPDEVTSIEPTSFVNINANPGEVLNFSVTTGIISQKPDDDLADFTVTGIGATIYDPISGNINGVAELPVDVQKIPEPMTILGSVVALGFGGLMKKNQNRKSN
jgi:hypothetical protein